MLGSRSDCGTKHVEDVSCGKNKMFINQREQYKRKPPGAGVQVPQLCFTCKMQSHHIDAQDVNMLIMSPIRPVHYNPAQTKFVYTLLCTFACRLFCSDNVILVSSSSAVLEGLLEVLLVAGCPVSRSGF